MGAYITSIGTALPKHCISQQEIARFMQQNLLPEQNKQKEIEVIFRASGISQRHTVLADYTRSLGEFDFFPNTPRLEPFPGVSRRMDVYRKEAKELGKQAAQNSMQQHRPDSFTHLITVSCTGMYAPGLDFDLVKSLNLPATIERTAINFMGCYAAFNALKAAHSICQSLPRAKVLIVCVELCSLHFQKKMDADTLLANALFGDGAAAVVVEGNPSSSVCLEMNGFHCDLMTEGQQDMTWNIGDFGFEMTLSSYVPNLIQQGIKSLTDGLFQPFDISTDDIDFFAIHPGGKKILEVIEQKLNIPRHKNSSAFEVLKQHGNMSSPTILFVLKKIMNSLHATHQDSKVLGLAFGPGLTLESMLLTAHCHD